MTAPIDHSGRSDQEANATSRIVVGLFMDRSEAVATVRELKDVGFTDEQIGVAMQDRNGNDGVVNEAGLPVLEGAATGAVTGGIAGGLIGLLGSLLVPGLGPVLVGGVLASTLLGLGIGAATGGLVGALTGMGVPESDAKHFDRGLRAGGTLVTVDAGGRTPEALDILESHGADTGPTSPKAGSQSESEGREDRRYRDDPSYLGPERRVVGV